MLPLFKAYPRLAEGLPYVPLGALPTPVRTWQALGARHGVGRLDVKCDDLAGPLYGGNKVRKLEFLLGAAEARGAQSVLTFGAAGSNHALATAIYARQRGLRAISLLVPQPMSPTIGANLLRGLAAGARLRHFLGRGAVARGTFAELAASRRETGRLPYIIPAGGSSPVGCVGFVNAAFELRDQIAAGALPKPDLLYVASGTMGTCVGLVLGLAAAGLDIRVEAVRVTTPPFTSLEKARRLFTRTLNLLRQADPAFPALAFPEERFSLRERFLGTGYGRATPESSAAVAEARDVESAVLEGTYTGKALACLLADGDEGRLRDASVLFWNTYNSRPLAPVIEEVSYHQLPVPFHRYFAVDSDA